MPSPQVGDRQRHDFDCEKARNEPSDGKIQNSRGIMKATDPSLICTKPSYTSQKPLQGIDKISHGLQQSLQVPEEPRKYDDDSGQSANRPANEHDCGEPHDGSPQASSGSGRRCHRLPQTVPTPPTESPSIMGELCPEYTPGLSALHQTAAHASSRSAATATGFTAERHLRGGRPTTLRHAPTRKHRLAHTAELAESTSAARP